MPRSLIMRFLISRLCSSLADQLLMFAVPLIVYHSTNSVAMSGVALFIEWVPRMISLPIAGSLNDRVGGWRIYGLADSLRAVSCGLTLLLALWWPAQVFPLVASLMAICAFFYAQAFIALEATVSLVIAVEEMPKTQSVLQAINQGSMIGGPMLAALAVVWMEPVCLLSIAAVLFGLSATLVYSLRTPLQAAFERVQRQPARNVLADFQVAAGMLWEQPVLVKLIGLSMLVNLIIGLSLATGAALTVSRFGQSNTHFGALQVAVGVLSLASFFTLPWLTRRVSVFSLGRGAYYVMAAGGIVIGLAAGFPVFVTGFALACGLSGIFNVYIRTERVQWLPREHMGKAISLIVLLNQLSLPLSGLLVSFTAHWLDIQQMFLIVAVLAIVCGLVLFPNVQCHSRTVVPAAVTHSG